MIDETHAPDRSNWVESAAGHATFLIRNFSLGVFSPEGGSARGGVAIGDSIFDIGAAGSSTVSGTEPGPEGCLLEMTRGGRNPIALPNGETRTYLVDGDEVIFRGTARRDVYTAGCPTPAPASADWRAPCRSGSASAGGR